MSIREQLLSPRQRRVVAVTIDGMEVQLRELYESERTEFDLWIRDAKGQVRPSRMKDTRLKLIQLTVVEKDGSLAFTEDDFDAMRQWPSRLTSGLAERAMKLSGLSDDDLEGEIKNSGAASG